jgi:hypothetical protein
MGVLTLLWKLYHTAPSWDQLEIYFVAPWATPPHYAMALAHVSEARRSPPNIQGSTVAASSSENYAAGDYIAQIDDSAGVVGVNTSVVFPKHLCMGLVTPADTSGLLQMSLGCLLTRSQWFWKLLSPSWDWYLARESLEIVT